MNRERGFEKVIESEWVKHRGCDWDDLKLPKRATNRAAAYDFFAPFDFNLVQGDEIKIALGIKAYMLGDEYLAIHTRSSNGFKHYVRLANVTGVIDSDYYANSDNDGNIFLKIRNESHDPTDILIVREGDAICQGIFQEYLLADGDSHFNGQQRVGGIGSTG